MAPLHEMVRDGLNFIVDAEHPQWRNLEKK
jgi:hypothetical protein